MDVFGSDFFNPANPALVIFVPPKSSDWSEVSFSNDSNPALVIFVPPK